MAVLSAAVVVVLAFSSYTYYYQGLRLAAQEEQISSLQSEDSSMQGQVTSLGSLASNLQNQLDRVQQSQNASDSQIATLSSALNGIRGELAVVKSELSSGDANLTRVSLLLQNLTATMELYSQVLSSLYPQDFPYAFVYLTHAVVSPSGVVTATLTNPSSYQSSIGGYLVAYAEEGLVEGNTTYWTYYSEAYSTWTVLQPYMPVNITVGEDQAGTGWTPPLVTGDQYEVVVYFNECSPAGGSGGPCLSLSLGTFAYPLPFVES